MNILEIHFLQVISISIRLLGRHDGRTSRRWFKGNEPERHSGSRVSITSWRLPAAVPVNAFLNI